MKAIDRDIERHIDLGIPHTAKGYSCAGVARDALGATADDGGWIEAMNCDCAPRCAKN
jgi:hypothetical protein